MRDPCLAHDNKYLLDEFVVLIEESESLSENPRNSKEVLTARNSRNRIEFGTEMGKYLKSYINNYWIPICLPSPRKRE